MSHLKRAALEALGLNPDLSVIAISGAAETFAVEMSDGVTYEYVERNLTQKQRDAILTYLNGTENRAA